MIQICGIASFVEEDYFYENNNGGLPVEGETIGHTVTSLSVAVSKMYEEVLYVQNIREKFIRMHTSEVEIRL